MPAQKLTFELPSSLSFQRAPIISDARMYSEVDGEYIQYPVEVVRHGIRGTQNVLKGSDSSGEASNTVSKDDVRNLQIIESAKLHPQAKRLVVEYSFSFADLAYSLSSISIEKGTQAEFIAQFKASIDQFIQRSKASNGVVEVAHRFARNILNGRWLWRNRLIASKVTTIVLLNGVEIASEDALKIPLNRFEAYSDQEHCLAKILVELLRGERTDWLLVRAFVEPMGFGAIEVYPSQNYYDKPRYEKTGQKHDKNGGGKVGRTLYVYGKSSSMPDNSGPSFVGYAALRDQKIGNALRTIDTWYDDRNEFVEPIAVEPMGASLKDLEYFRLKKKSAFDMLKRLNEIDPDSAEGMFMISSFIRGGVFTRSTL